LTRKFFELSGHAARSSRIASTHHQTVFEPPFMTASARYCRSWPSIAVPVGSPNLKPSAQGRGGGAAQRCRLATSRDPSVGVQMVREPCW